VSGGKDWLSVEENGSTAIPGTFAGGDVLKIGLVTVAIANGRKAAETIHNRFQGIQPEKEIKPPVITHEKMLLSYYQSHQRNEADALKTEERLQNLSLEIVSAFTEEQARDEAKRCMSCGACFDCGSCWSYCQDQAIEKPVIKHQTYRFKIDFCKGCSKCAESCPCGVLEMK
jgi:formate dehydrogenase (NADP+) beta subunit